jgi:hypothetical protein
MAVMPTNVLLFMSDIAPLVTAMTVEVAFLRVVHDHLAQQDEYPQTRG